MHIEYGGFIDKEIKDRAYILKYSNIYLKKYRNYENYEKIAHRNSILCYYFAKGFYSHNNNKLYIKPYIKEILYNPLSFKQVLELKGNITKIALLWLLGKCPYTIIRLFFIAVR